MSTGLPLGTEEPQQRQRPSSSSADRVPYSSYDARTPPTDATTTSVGPEKDVESSGAEPLDEFKPGIRFWAVLLALGVASFQASLENSVVTTAGPAIVADLGMGEEYIWMANAFFVACAAFQPLFGQLCNVFGRRSLMLFVTALFTLGSGICGGATNGSMLIAGRAIQGAGSGGMVMLVHVILADLVPLRVNYKRDATVAEKLRSIDWVGNALTMAGTVVMLYALANAGTKYDWSSWHTLVPLLVGFFIVVCFSLWESYGNVVLPKWSFEPVMPPRLFHHRTSLIVAINTFLHWMLVYWAIYFIPLWFQAVFLYSAETAGVDMLPMSLVAVPGSALAAAAVSRWGRFQWLHLVGEVIFTVCMGLFALQWVGTTTTEWASIQSVCALGGGIVLDTLLPAFQAPVPESDQAAATATWAFIRTLLHTISDPVVWKLLAGGGGYAHASADFIKPHPVPVRSEIQHVYREALRLVFLTSVAFGGAASVLFLFEKDVVLRKGLETEYGLVEDGAAKKPETERGSKE